MNTTAVWYLACHDNYMYTTYDEYNRCMIFGIPRESYVHYLRWIQPLYDIWHTTRIIYTLLTMNTTAVWYLAYHENYRVYVHYLRWIQPLYDIWHTTRIICTLLTMNTTAVWYLAYHENHMYTTYDEYNRCMIFGIPRQLYVHYLRWIQPLCDSWHTTRIICTQLTMNAIIVWYFNDLTHKKPGKQGTQSAWLPLMPWC